MSNKLDYLHLPFDPIANPDAVVAADHVRFTVLTSRLLRLEYSPTGQFEDHPSQAFWFRKQPVPAFAVRREAGRIEIETEHLLLRYTENDRGFTPVTLCVTLKATGDHLVLRRPHLEGGQPARHDAHAG